MVLLLELMDVIAAALAAFVFKKRVDGRDLSMLNGPFLTYLLLCNFSQMVFIDYFILKDTKG